AASRRARANPRACGSEGSWWLPWRPPGSWDCVDGLQHHHRAVVIGAAHGDAVTAAEQRAVGLERDVAAGRAVLGIRHRVVHQLDDVARLDGEVADIDCRFGVVAGSGVPEAGAEPALQVFRLARVGGGADAILAPGGGQRRLAPGEL